MAKPDPNGDAQEDSKRSGARRVALDVGVDEQLPATPAVMTNRPRIVTGRYSIIKPPRVPMAK